MESYEFVVVWFWTSWTARTVAEICAHIMGGGVVHLGGGRTGRA